MSDKLDHFVLEYDDESGLALLAMTEADGGRVADGAGLPYACLLYTSPSPRD